MLYKIDKNSLINEEKEILSKLDLVKVGDKNIDFSAGFYYYDEFPISETLKEIIKLSISNNYLFDYSNDELNFLAKKTIKDYLNLINEYSTQINEDNIFLSSGVFSGLQLINYVLLDLLGNKRKILLITPNFLESVKIITTSEDEIYIYDYTLDGEDGIFKIIEEFDLVLCENPMWPQGFFLSNNFISHLSKISKFVLLDKSISSYIHPNFILKQSVYGDNVIIFNSISKEFGITFKGFFISKDDTINKLINYYFESFGFTSNITTPVLSYIYLYKIYLLNTEKYLDIKMDNNFNNILEKYNLNDFFFNENNFIELSNRLNQNLNNFLLNIKFLRIFLKDEIESNVFKIYEINCGMNLQVGILKKGLSEFEMYKIMVEKFSIELGLTFLPVGFKENINYNLFRLNVSTGDKKGFIIGVKHLKKFLTEY